MLIDEIRAIKSTRKDLRSFGFVVGAVLSLLGLILLWRGRPAWPYLLGIGLALTILGTIFPSSLKPLQKLWMIFAVFMGWFMTRLILSVLFFLVLTPIGLAARVAGRRFLDRHPESKVDSYWNLRDGQEQDRKRYEKQF